MARKNLSKQEQPRKNPAGAPPSVVIQNIDVRPFGRREQDIPSWRNALRSAESLIPRRLLLYDLYADVDLDGHVEAVTGKRRDAVTTAEWKFVDKEGKDIDQINEIIDSIGFEEMLEEIVNSKFWGYSILEPTFYQSDGTWEMEANLIPRLNYRPEKGIIAKDYSSDEGLNIREGIYAKTVMEVGRPKDLGLYLKAAPYQVLKRGGLGDWALFVQVFGNPIVDATWDGFDEGQRLKLLEAINQLGSGGALVRPDGTNINLIENKTNANGDLQDKFMTFLNKEISKSLLGSTETTEASQSSGYAQSKTHEGQDERKNESDITFTRRVLNSRFIRILQTHGFDTQGGRFVVQGEDNELTVYQSFEMHRKMAVELNLPIDDDFWYDTYGVPKPDNYEQIKKERRETEDRRPKQEKEKSSTEKVTLSEEEGKTLAEKVKEAAESYIKKVYSFFPMAPDPATVTGAVIPMQIGNSTVPALVDCCGDPLTIKLALSAEPDFKSLLKAVVKADGKSFLYPDLALHNIDLLSDGFQMGWKSEGLVTLAQVGFDYHTTDPKMQTAWEMNIFKFSTVKAAYESNEVNALFRKSKNFAEFERMVKKLYGVQNKRWLQTEYNTAYQTAEAAATYYRLQKQSKTFPYWELRTIGDNRVREAHRLLHGFVAKWDDPCWKKIYPPNGWGCRCYIVPRLAGEVTPAMLEASQRQLELFYKSEEWAKSRKSGFGINRGDTKEVFTATQSYSEDSAQAVENIGKMTAEAWNMKPAQETRELLGKESWDIHQERTVIDQFINAHKVSNTKLGLSDYAGRPIAGSISGIKAHTNPDREQYSERHNYLLAVPEVLNDPHEVWAHDTGKGEFDTLSYFRYFKNVIIKAVCTLSDTGDLRLSTWYPIGPEDADRQRRGVPVKK